MALITRQEANRLWGSMPVPSDFLKKKWLDFIFSLTGQTPLVQGATVNGVAFTTIADAVAVAVDGDTIFVVYVISCADGF